MSERFILRKDQDQAPLINQISLHLRTSKEIKVSLEPKDQPRTVFCDGDKGHQALKLFLVPRTFNGSFFRWGVTYEVDSVCGADCPDCGITYYEGSTASTLQEFMSRTREELRLNHPTVPNVKTS